MQNFSKSRSLLLSHQDSLFSLHSFASRASLLRCQFVRHCSPRSSPVRSNTHVTSFCVSGPLFLFCSACVRVHAVFFVAKSRSCRRAQGRRVFEFSAFSGIAPVSRIGVSCRGVRRRGRTACCCRHIVLLPEKTPHQGCVYTHVQRTDARHRVHRREHRHVALCRRTGQNRSQIPKVEILSRPALSLFTFCVF